MRFTLTTHPYHSLVSLIFIVLTNLSVQWYLHDILFCILWKTNDIDYFSCLLAIWIWSYEMSIPFNTYFIFFLMICCSHLYTLDKALFFFFFFGKFFFPLKFYIGGMSGWIMIYTFLIFLVLLDFAFPFVL